MKKLLLNLAIVLLVIGNAFAQDKNGTPNPHGLQLQYCYGSIKKAYNLSAGPHILDVVKNMPHLVFWNHTVGAWGTGFIDMKIFEETAPATWTLVQSYLNLDYLAMSGYTFPGVFTFTSNNYYKVEFYIAGTTTPLDINSSTQVYIKAHDMSIAVKQLNNPCTPPVYQMNSAINYELFPLNMHRVGCYRITDPAHLGYDNIVSGYWNFSKGANTVNIQEYSCMIPENIAQPFENPTFNYLYDGINDPCYNGTYYGECYSWTGSGPSNFCKDFVIKVGIWAYDINSTNPSNECYNPCHNPIDGEQESSCGKILMPNVEIECEACISTKITVCKFCKPVIVVDDGPIDIKAYPNPKLIEEPLVIDISGQLDSYFIEEIRIYSVLNGRLIHELKNLRYSGPNTSLSLQINEPEIGVYEVVGKTNQGDEVITRYIVQ